MIWRFGILLAALAAPVSASAAVRAVFVGIDNYQFSRSAGVASAGFDDLSGAVGDTLRIKATLARVYGLALDAPSPGGCRSGNATSITLTNTCATKAAILQAWNSAIAASQPGDTLILYFAGHGSRFIDDRALDQASRYNSTLMATNARQPGAVANADILDHEVRAVIDRATAKGVRVVTWFDSCNSGTASRDGQSASRTAPDLRVSGLRPIAQPAQYGTYGAYRVHLGAAGDGQDAKEVGSVGARAGVFTTALASALQAMPRASFADIAASVVKEVTQQTRGRQVPHAEGALRAALDGPEIKVATFDVVRDGNQLILAGGALVGITPGSRFALYPGTSAALRVGGDAPLLRARIVQVAPGMAVLAPEGPLPAGLPGRMVAREEMHGFGALKLGLAVADPAALAAVRRLGFVAVDARGPFALVAGPAGMELRGRGGTALATLPPATAAEFGVRLASALEKIARVEAWLNVVRPRPGVGLCVLNGNRATFDPAYCPPPPGRRTLKLEQPALVSIINESDAPRHGYVFAVGQKYDVTLVLPGFGAREPALAPGQALPIPDGQDIVPDETGPLRFVAIASDVPLNATVLEQSSTDMVDTTACLSAVARAFCLGADGARGGGGGRVNNWSAAVIDVEVVP
ncbi:caspase family protein [Sandarakinorhabdus sp.]|uniref:caspase family protein n=1 Tax=Sandarakinorhabdus sp. TaxID=1916663 RepID=UPI0033412812